MENADGVVKLGLIGCGQVAETRHLPALQHVPNADVIAVGDTDPNRLDALAGRFRIEGRYPHHRALLDDPNVDAVAVCVPAQFHVEIALDALDADKHVFVEKPLALSLDDADQLIERAAHTSRQVTVGFNFRWHHLIRRAREMIQRGTLGPIALMCSTLTSNYQNVPEWRKHRESGGGVLFEMAVHHFDLWRFLLQSEVDDVFATTQSGQWEDESSIVTARMRDGVQVSGTFSETTAGTHEVEIYGRQGRLRVSCYRFDGLEFLPASSYAGDIRIRLQNAVRILREWPHVISSVRGHNDVMDSYQAEWQHFVDAIQHGSPVDCTLEDGRRALQIALAAVESAHRGAPVQVAQAPSSIPTGSS